LEKKRCPACHIDSRRHFSPTDQKNNRAIFSTEPQAAQARYFGYSAAVEIGFGEPTLSASLP
jgi:hypothetical protein